MDIDQINERIKQLNIEDFIWIIYIGIIGLSFISNHYERYYFLYGNNKDKNKYRKITITIFSILIVVYLYFLKDSVDSLKNISFNTNKKISRLTYLSFIASLLIAISGFIYLYIAFTDEDLNVEIAFN